MFILFNCMFYSLLKTTHYYLLYIMLGNLKIFGNKKLPENRWRRSNIVDGFYIQFHLRSYYIVSNTRVKFDIDFVFVK